MHAIATKTFAICCGAAVFGIASVAAAASLEDVLNDASACSDALLQDYASSSCDSPETIAAMAVAKCRAKWNAVTSRAVGTPPSDASPSEQARSQRIYSEAMENEYVRVAELKAIDIRTAARTCGFD